MHLKDGKKIRKLEYLRLINLKIKNQKSKIEFDIKNKLYQYEIIKNCTTTQITCDERYR